MSRSRIKTLLPLEEYARIMSIPGWHFNQVEHPQRAVRGACDTIWLQSGYASDPNRIVGRDEVAQAIAEAEYNIAHTCGFWPAPRWFCGDRDPPVAWPEPQHGGWQQYPALRTRWGYLIAGGQETWDQLNTYGVVVDYTDEDGDGVNEIAEVTYGFYLDDIEDACEVLIVPLGYDPSQEYAIKPLEITIAGGVLTARGYTWQFVDPALWNTIDALMLDNADNFVPTVDIWRHYNYPYKMAEIHWPAGPCETPPCSDLTQDACLSVTNPRNGIFIPQTGVFNGNTLVWTRQEMLYCRPPRDVAMWYYAGYRDPTCDSCDYMGPSLKRAIVSLANCYMSDPPCGCDITLDRWEKDREEQKMDTFNVAMAKSHFGTSARGAVYAYSVVKRIPPLGKGG